MSVNLSNGINSLSNTASALAGSSSLTKPSIRLGPIEPGPIIPPIDPAPVPPPPVIPPVEPGPAIPPKPDPSPAAKHHHGKIYNDFSNVGKDFSNLAHDTWKTTKDIVSKTGHAIYGAGHAVIKNIGDHKKEYAIGAAVGGLAVGGIAYAIHKFNKPKTEKKEEESTEV